MPAVFWPPDSDRSILSRTFPLAVRSRSHSPPQKQRALSFDQGIFVLFPEQEVISYPQGYGALVTMMLLLSQGSTQASPVSLVDWYVLRSPLIQATLVSPTQATKPQACPWWVPIAWTTIPGYISRGPESSTCHWPVKLLTDILSSLDAY